MPPVSMIVQGVGVAVQGAEIRSRVTPGWSWTMAIFRPARRLKSADFPTLGRPTIATVGMRGARRALPGLSSSNGQVGKRNRGIRAICGF